MEPVDADFLLQHLPDDLWMEIFKFVAINIAARMSIANKMNRKKFWNYVTEIDGRYLDYDANFTIIFHRYFKRANRYLYRLSSVRIAQHNLREGRVNPFPTIALLPQLQKLDLSTCIYLKSPTTDYLSVLTNLTELSLAKCGSLRDDHSVAYWSRFWLRCGAKLKYLNISGCEGLSESSGFRYLTCLSALTHLEAGVVTLRSSMTNAIFQLSNLLVLDLHDALVAADTDFRSISKLQSLVTLKMSHMAGVSDNIVKHIGTLVGLTYLDIGRLQRAISSEGFLWLSSLRNLEHLNLQQSLKLEDPVLSTLLRSMPKLRHLSLRFCFNISLDGALALGACKQLTYVDLSMTDISKQFDNNAEDLQRIVGLSTLEISMTTVY